MKPCDPLKLSESILTQLKEGAFLTVKAGEALNTMTIGWGLIGFLWQKPVFMVPVRDSRHTFTLLEQATDFTVSVPSGDKKDALSFCGTRSGRDLDKLKACGLTTRPAQRTITPILDMAGLHLECRILYGTPLDRTRLDPALLALYPKGDFHTLYFGEIATCYEL
jgi:flavin reductase (DIM6/NTAB) family NADH-FMN oxidoreductase RutF